MKLTFNSCPRCGSDEIAHGYSMPPMVWSVQCYAEDFGCITAADTEQACASLWNSGAWQYRPIEWDEMGSPCELELNPATPAAQREG